MYENNEIESLIIKYLTGETSTDDIIILSDWLKTDKNNELIFRRIKAYWEANVSTDFNIDYENTFDNLLNRIHKEAERTPSKKRWLIYLNAATIAAMIIGFIVYLNIYRNTPQVHYYSYMSGTTTSEFNLPDGSRIFLNKNSKLTYSDDFGNHERNVRLQGEAYFDVAKDKDKPFTVELDSSKVTVLGTSFNIKNRTGEDLIAVVLVEGSVQFQSPEENIIMSPRQELVYNKSEKKIITVNKVDTEVTTAWKQNLIRYKSKTLAEITKILEEQYNVKIIINSRHLDETQMTGAFDANANIEQILNIMKNNIRFNWKKESTNTYLITD